MEVRERINAHLLDTGNRLQIEDALAVELLLANPQMDCATILERVIDVWEHMLRRQPEVLPVENEKHPNDATVAFFSPEGEEILMKIVLVKGGYKLRSIRGTVPDRQSAENRWRHRQIPPAVLAKLAARERARNETTARLGA